MVELQDRLLTLERRLQDIDQETAATKAEAQRLSVELAGSKEEIGDLQAKFPKNALQSVLEGHVHGRIRAEKGDAAPTHSAPESTLYWDTTNNNLYINDDGATAWTKQETGGAGAPTDADYLVGTTHPSLSAEIVVGTTPGGELGGTWASPTVDPNHGAGDIHEFVEISTPSDPAEDKARLFLRDNGTNSDFVLRSATGDECIICTIQNVSVAHTNTLTLNWITD